MTRPVFSMLIAIAAAGASALAQAPTDAARFQNASIKKAALRVLTDRTPLGTMRGGPGTVEPEHINYRGVTPLQLLRLAYGKMVFEISGGPDWLIKNPLATPRLDIIADVPPGTSKEQFNVMLQNLMADHLGLKVHHEKRELPTYTITVAKSGPKLKEMTVKPGMNGVSLVDMDPGFLLQSVGGGVAIATLASALQNKLNALVVDKTGLTGTYEFNLEFADAPTTDGPPILAAALEHDAGLILEKSKADFDVLVIDHIEFAPTAN